jgi:hypothetical protein
MSPRSKLASNEIKISLKIAAPIDKVWAAIADWESQGAWMLQTRVWVTSDIRSGVGTSISALTGPLVKSGFKFGLLDKMVVTNWLPPRLCEVDHVGKVIKGTGKFELTDISSGQEIATNFDWSETIKAPKVLFYLIYLPTYLGVRISLLRFRRSLTKR